MWVTWVLNGCKAGAPILHPNRTGADTGVS